MIHRVQVWKIRAQIKPVYVKVRIHWRRECPWFESSLCLLAFLWEVCMFSLCAHAYCQAPSLSSKKLYEMSEWFPLKRESARLPPSCSGRFVPVEDAALIGPRVLDFTCIRSRQRNENRHSDKDFDFHAGLKSWISVISGFTNHPTSQIQDTTEWILWGQRWALGVSLWLSYGLRKLLTPHLSGTEISHNAASLPRGRGHTNMWICSTFSPFSCTVAAGGVAETFRMVALMFCLMSVCPFHWFQYL